MKWNRALLFIFIAFMATFLSACSTQNGNNTGFFQTFLIDPFANLIHGTATLFNGNFGLSIILITIVIRLLLMPLMLKQYKSQQQMKEKMEMLKPELELIQNRMKETTDPQKKQEIQMEMFGLYKKHNVNPLSMGCLPLIIQMPILMGFYYAIRGSAEIASHSFLWFSLGQPDIAITAIAGIVYYLQFKVSFTSLPVEQQKQMKIMGLMSPIMIVVISLNAPAALPLYWTVGGFFLIFQTWIGKKLYRTQPKEEKTKIEKA